jgi:hypothetical protein
VRLTIRDRNTLNAVRPIDAMTYLRSAGWVTQERLGDKGVILAKAGEPSESALTVPLRSDLADFAVRISEMLSILERIEGRSEFEILTDINATSFDLIRVRSASALAASGSIPIDLGVSLFEQAREMMLAAACSTVSPKAYWARRRPKQAITYLEGVRLGQTERGSYVLTVQSPIPPAFKGESFGEDPFERQVSQTLIGALSYTKDAAQQALTSEDFEPFRRGIEKGVSANLCDALVNLARATQESALEVSVTLSRNRPNETPHSHFSATFQQDLIPVIEEASRVFKETAPEEEFSLFGFVERLDRAVGTPTGRIAIRQLVAERPRKIVIDLPESWYHEAIRAHDENNPIFCVGELVREGRTFQLLNPREFMVVRGNDQDTEAQTPDGGAEGK